MYDSETADCWKIDHQGKQIEIELKYGDIFKKGIASDLKLHPKLVLKFEDTDDIQVIDEFVQLIIRFFRLIRYDANCGNIETELINIESGKKSYNGQFVFIEKKYSRSLIPSISGIEYICYKPYIQKYLQFASDNISYIFDHYPMDGYRYLGAHYSENDFFHIFSAFENECRVQKEKYERVDVSAIEEIKNEIISKIKEVKSKGVTEEESKFISVSLDRIQQQGTQLGQRKKIINVYRIVEDILSTSIENIFYRPEFKKEKKLSSTEISKIASYLVDKRGTIAHGGMDRDK